jgi:hypothetical protein
VSDPRYGPDVKKGLVLEGGGMAGTLGALWPDELPGLGHRIPVPPGLCSCGCGGYSQQSYGGLRFHLHCAIERREKGRATP